MADLLHEKLHVDLVTPTGRLFEGTCDEVRAPGGEGGFGVLPGHTPFLTTLDAGVLTIVAGGKEDHFAVSGGFCEVAENRVTVLAEYAEHASSINPIAAKAELDAAHARLHEAHQRDEAQQRRQQAELHRAKARLAAGRHTH